MKVFNINSDIKVKLTTAGIVAFEKYYQDIANEYNLEREKLPKLPKPKNGYWTFQLWDFMRVFGPANYMGGPCLFEGNNIFIENKQFEQDI